MKSFSKNFRFCSIMDVNLIEFEQSLLFPCEATFYVLNIMCLIIIGSTKFKKSFKHWFN